MSTETKNETYETYLCEYMYGSKKFTFDIKATSFSDAAARLKAIGNSGEVLGKGGFSVPAFLMTPWLANVTIFVMNLFEKKR